MNIKLSWLLGLKNIKGFVINDLTTEDEKQLDYISGMILEKLGLNIDDSFANENYLENIIQCFPEGFPTTRIFSEFARNSFGEFNPLLPDRTLLEWMGHEEMLFRTYERYLVNEKLKNKFEDVDDFIKYSLSVHNRRKSRAGFALENHLEELFKLNKLEYARGAKTENKSKPDFLFPGKKEYDDMNFPTQLLTMLGVKTSCKDRWRQVLTEAQRIDTKHLATLEPGISEDQTAEMITHNLQLVVPQEVHSTYSESQKAYLMSLEQFIEEIKNKQSN